ncbi:MAG: very short patch repair endonuclease [Terriglobia bacterium]
MRRIRSKDTKPEMAVRRLVHRLGYRYRLHRCDLPGRPDMVFQSRRKAIFVHGCFWHQHGRCIDSHIPVSRRSYWAPKLRRNKKRDEKNIALLKTLGWRCLVVWECQVATSARLARRIKQFLG